MSLLLRAKVEGYFDKLSKKVYTFLIMDGDTIRSLDEITCYQIISDSLDNAINELVDSSDMAILNYILYDYEENPYDQRNLGESMLAQKRIDEAFNQLDEKEQDQIWDGHLDKGGKMEEFLNLHRVDIIKVLKQERSYYFQVKIKELSNFE